MESLAGGKENSSRLRSPCARRRQICVAVAAGEAGERRDRVRVVWDRYSEPRYRFSIDDNSFFLRDIAQKGYSSLFDCLYLKMLRDLHDKYGVKFTVNIYYTTGEDFKLPQFPDRYKGEWRDNSHWIRLAFHAYANKPQPPYQDAPPEKLHGRLGPGRRPNPPLRRRGKLRPADGDPLGDDTPHGVQAAGEPGRSRVERLLPPGMAGRGTSTTAGTTPIPSIFRGTTPGRTSSSGIVFSRVSIVCNSVPVDRIVATLEPLAKDPNLGRDHGPVHPRAVLLAVLHATTFPTIPSGSTRRSAG